MASTNRGPARSLASKQHHHPHQRWISAILPCRRLRTWIIRSTIHCACSSTYCCSHHRGKHAPSRRRQAHFAGAAACCRPYLGLRLVLKLRQRLTRGADQLATSRAPHRRDRLAKGCSTRRGGGWSFTLGCVAVWTWGQGCRQEHLFWWKAWVLWQFGPGTRDADKSTCLGGKLHATPAKPPALGA